MTAVRVKKSLSECGANATISGLVGGKSALQNELLGELQEEFGAAGSER